MNAASCNRSSLIWFVVMVAAAVLTTQAFGQPVIQIIEKGIYRAETTARTITHEATGVLNTVRDARLISNTDVVYAKLGTRFGLRYVLAGTSSPSLALKLVIKFPAGGLRDPVSGAHYGESAQGRTIPSGIAGYWGYQFENDWEIVPGLWVFEFWLDSSRLASQSFCIVDASQPLDAAKNRQCVPLVSRPSNDLLRRR